MYTLPSQQAAASTNPIDLGPNLISSIESAKLVSLMTSQVFCDLVNFCFSSKTFIFLSYEQVASMFPRDGWAHLILLIGP